jgi:hypothetical protein
MSTLAEYFAEHRPKPRYQVGDRVEGIYKGMPYVGTAYTDNMRSELEGPMVSVHLDLPLKIGTVWLTMIRVSYKEIKGLRK